MTSLLIKCPLWLRWCVAFGIAFASTAAASDPARDYPNRSLKIIVPYGPGASADQIARKFGELLSKQIGQPVVVENKPGGSTSVGFNTVSKANPDGYTLLFSSASVAVYNPLLQKNLPYNVDDLKTISLLVDVPLNLLTNAQTPVKSIQELVQYGRANPKSLNYSSAGTGTSTHLAGEFLKQELGIDMSHVPYTGNAAAMLGLLRNDVQLMFDAPAPPLPHIQSGKVRALGLGSRERLKMYGDTPTIRESGYPDFVAGLWYGIAIHKDTDPKMVDKLRQSIDKVVTSDEFRDAADTVWGASLIKPMTQPELDSYINQERQMWRKIVDKAGISIDQK